MSLHGTGFCIMCGAHLETGHRFCWSCGAPRWAPDEGEPDGRPPAVGDQRPPPVPGTPAMQAIASHTEPPTLGLLPWFYAAGAVFFLVWATQALAVFVSPIGRGQLVTDIAQQGLGPGQADDIVGAQQLLHPPPGGLRPAYVRHLTRSVILCSLAFGHVNGVREGRRGPPRNRTDQA